MLRYTGGEQEKHKCLLIPLAAWHWQNIIWKRYYWVGHTNTGIWGHCSICANSQYSTAHFFHDLPCFQQPLYKIVPCAWMVLICPFPQTPPCLLPSWRPAVHLLPQYTIPFWFPIDGLLLRPTLGSLTEHLCGCSNFLGWQCCWYIE